MPVTDGKLCLCYFTVSPSDRLMPGPELAFSHVWYTVLSSGCLLPVESDMCCDCGSKDGGLHAHWGAVCHSGSISGPRGNDDFVAGSNSQADC